MSPREGGAPPPTVQPLPVPLPLALLRAVFTVAAWSITAAPLTFLLLPVVFLIGALQTLGGGTDFSETDLGDGAISAVFAGMALVSGIGLTVTVLLWLLLPAVEIRLAESVAAQQAISAQDCRRFERTAAQRLAVLLLALSLLVLCAGVVIAVYGFIADEPDLGGRWTALLMVVPGVLITALTVGLWLAVAPRASARLQSLRRRWPVVTSRPEPIDVVVARERAERGLEGRRATAGRRRAAPSGTASRRLPVHPAVLLIGLAVVALMIVDRTGENGPITVLLMVLLSTGIGILIVRAARRAFRRAQQWDWATSPERTGTATVIDYRRRHPWTVLASTLAVIGALTLGGSLSFRWLPAAILGSAPGMIGIVLGIIGAATAALAIAVSAIEHRRTREWRARFLRAHPETDPVWTPDLLHPGLQEIHGWLNG